MFYLNPCARRRRIQWSSRLLEWAWTCGRARPQPIVVYRCCSPAATNETLVGPRQQKRNAADEKNSGSCGLFGNAARVTVMNRGSCAAAPLPSKKPPRTKRIRGICLSWLNKTRGDVRPVSSSVADVNKLYPADFRGASHHVSTGGLPSTETNPSPWPRTE